MAIQHTHRKRNTLIAALLVLLLFGTLLYALRAIDSRNHPPDDAITESSPYGFTVLDDFTAQTVARLKQLGVSWIRYQHNWYDIEPQRDQFDWRLLDAAVSLANANHIHITFPIQGAPRWALQQMCLGSRFLPAPSDVAHFAAALAYRYNGTLGHGYIAAYEVGNEEYDIMLLDNENANLHISLPCRAPNFYGPVLKAAYQVIKKASPRAPVGMFGLWWENKNHITYFMHWLYTNGFGAFFDFANFHYYVCKERPDSSSPTRPSFQQEWQFIHSIMAKYHDSRKPIWVTEIGWPTNSVWQHPSCVVSPYDQALYIEYVLKAAMQSHVIKKVFWYTIDRGDDGMSLTQTRGLLPGFYTFKRFVRRYSYW
jgi:hypothetical protein